MSEKRFSYGETDLFEWVEDNGKMISTKECVNKLNEQQDIITELNKQIEQLNLAIDDLLSHTSCDEIKKENKQLQEIINRLEEAIEKRGYDSIDEFW